MFTYLEIPFHQNLIRELGLDESKKKNLFPFEHFPGYMGNRQVELVGWFRMRGSLLPWTASVITIGFIRGIDCHNYLVLLEGFLLRTGSFFRLGTAGHDRVVGFIDSSLDESFSSSSLVLLSLALRSITDVAIFFPRLCFLGLSHMAVLS